MAVGVVQGESLVLCYHAIGEAWSSSVSAERLRHHVEFLLRRGYEPRRFVELGLNRFANDAADWRWLKGLGGELVLVDDVLRDGTHAGFHLERVLAGGSGFVSIDLDGIDGAFAPGVSAKNPLGVRVEHAAELAEMAGLRPEVRHFDLMEPCPPHDVDGRTARVAAYLFLAFMAGFARRPV